MHFDRRQLLGPERGVVEEQLPHWQGPARDLVVLVQQAEQEERQARRPVEEELLLLLLPLKEVNAQFLEEVLQKYFNTYREQVAELQVRLKRHGVSLQGS